MKRTGKWLISLLGRSLAILLVIFLFPAARSLYLRYMPGMMGEIQTQSTVLAQKLQSTSRLEVTRVEEEGVIQSQTNVIILGTVGTATIRYRYSASIGIDLSQVVFTAESDRIVFSLPDPEVLNDGIEALQINRNDFFSRAIDKSTETLLNEQKEKCREQYLKEEHSQRIWKDTIHAFEETICEWLEPFGERHYQFEFIPQNLQAVG